MNLKTKLLSSILAFALFLTACSVRQKPPIENSTPAPESIPESIPEEKLPESSTKSQSNSSISSKIEAPHPAPILTVAMPKDDTILGMAQLMTENAEGGLYRFNVTESTDVLAENIKKDDYAIALVSLETAITLYKETDKQIKLVAIDRISEDKFTTGCIIAQSKIIEASPEAVDTFLTSYRNSVNFAKDTENHSLAAHMLEELDIMSKSEAEEAYTKVNFSFLRGEKMRETVEPLLASTDSIDENFYYIAG